MIIAWIIFTTVVMATFSFYMYSYFLKRLRHFRSTDKDKKLKLTALFLTVALVTPAMKTYGIWSVIITYCVIAELVLHLMCPLIKHFLKHKRPPMLKKLYLSGSLAALLAVLCFVMQFYNASHIKQTEYTVYTDKDIREEGYTIVMLADLHFGATMELENLKKQALRIAECKPDIVLLCGDIVDELTTAEDMPQVFEILGEIPSTYGVFYVYGNHDLQGYSSLTSYGRKELEYAAHRNGVRLLQDEVVALNDEITLIGRNDTSVEKQRKTAAELLSGVNTQTYLLLADHKPNEIVIASEHGYDMVLSGHTHAGQLWPLNLIFEFIHFSDLNYGYEKFNNTDAIVTSGIGGWGYPIRTVQHAEYVKINLRKSEGY